MVHKCKEKLGWRTNSIEFLRLRILYYYEPLNQMKSENNFVMKICKFSGLFLLVISAVCSISCAATAENTGVKNDENILMFPTSAYLQGDNWLIPIHGWVFEYEYESLWRKAGFKALSTSIGFTQDQMNSELFRKRAWMFLVDNKGGKEFNIQLSKQRFRLENSAANGHFENTITIHQKNLKNTLSNQWITYEVLTVKGDDRDFIGKVQLVEPTGVSIISDIDDTIKLSEVTDKKELLANTFIREFRAVPGMANIYNQWSSQGAVFHYVSSSPWQLYQSLNEFMVDTGFPHGSFQLRNFRVKDQSFIALFQSSYEYKIRNIEKLLNTFPKRKFLLIGDSGENDPAIYAEIATRFPKQVYKIIIRDVGVEAKGGKIDDYFSNIPKEQWLTFFDAQQLTNLALPY